MHRRGFITGTIAMLFAAPVLADDDSFDALWQRRVQQSEPVKITAIKKVAEPDAPRRHRRHRYYHRYRRRHRVE